MRLLPVCASLVLVCGGFAQEAPEKPGFEVASIKLSDPNPTSPMWIGMSADRAMVTYTNITLKDCISAAYRVRDFQITGPDWMSTARYEIRAKLPAGASSEQIPEMLRRLLEERFGLTIRRDTREEPVYALTIGKGGPNLKPAATNDSRSPTALGADGLPRPPMMFRYSPSGVTLTTPSATLADVATLISRFTERPVVDMTGLKDRYDLNLIFEPETARGLPPGPDGAAPSGEPAPSLFQAVQEYGLRLEARKAPLEMLTVTHVERTPIEN